jgi:putative endopeptidase
MLKPRVDELWQNATTMEQAMEAWGRATVAGYNSLFSPVVKVVTGQAAWVMDEGRPFYYDDMALSQLGKQELEKRRAYRGGQPIRRAAGQADANLTAFVKGLGLGLSADELVWEKEAKTAFESVAKTFTTVEAVKKEIEACVYMYDGLLISDDLLTAYNNVTYPTASGKQVKLDLTRSTLMSNIKFLYGSLYVVRDFNKKFITASMKSQYAAYCENFRAAFQKRLENNTWLSSETRANALDKLKNMEFFVATEPDATPDVATPKLKNEGIISLVRQLRQARLDSYKWMIGRTRREVIMLLSTFDFGVSCLDDNAYYDRATNAVFINPSNLLAPYIQDGDEDALRLAVLGSTIGHELTHGFDNGGRLYDKNGAYKNWWTPSDTITFNTYSKQLVENYSELLMMPWASKTLYDNGANTLGENIADIGGCCLGLDLLLGKYPDANPEEVKQLTKRYFQGWAIAWSSSYSLARAQLYYYEDIHSQERERTNGVVRNINAWYDAYDIESGTLYLEPAKRVAIW